MEPIDKKKYAVVLAVLGIASGCVYVFYSHKYNPGFTLVPLAFLLVVWMFVLNIWVPSSWTSKIPFIFRQLIYGLPFACLLAVISSGRSHYEQDQLKKFGVVVEGRVIDTHVQNGRQGSYFYVEIEYMCNNVTYTERLTDSVYTYRYHDELKVLCSSHDPEIFAIVGHKPALDIKY